jgi:hypothetical protein
MRWRFPSGSTSEFGFFGGAAVAALIVTAGSSSALTIGNDPNSTIQTWGGGFIDAFGQTFRTPVAGSLGSVRFFIRHSPFGLPRARLPSWETDSKSIPVMAGSERRLDGREGAAYRPVQGSGASNRAPSGTRVPSPWARLTVWKGAPIMRKRPQPEVRAGR